MDWTTIAPLVAGFAPTLGGFLGGLIPFPGGAFIGQKLGEIIASQFGVPATPQDVANAIKSNPDAIVIAKLNAATEQARIEVEGFRVAEEEYTKRVIASLEQTGLTMRAEIGREHWFFQGWRPACGWIMVVEASGFGIMLLYAAALAAFWNNPLPLKTLGDAWPIFLAYFGALGLVVGVYVFARTAEKTTPKPEVPATATPTKPKGKP